MEKLKQAGFAVRLPLHAKQWVDRRQMYEAMESAETKKTTREAGAPFGASGRAAASDSKASATQPDAAQTLGAVEGREDLEATTQEGDKKFRNAHDFAFAMAARSRSGRARADGQGTHGARAFAAAARAAQQHSASLGLSAAPLLLLRHRRRRRRSRSDLGSRSRSRPCRARAPDGAAPHLATRGRPARPSAVRTVAVSSTPSRAASAAAVHRRSCSGGARATWRSRWAAPSTAPEIRGEQPEIRGDREEIRGDRADFRGDREEIGRRSGRSTGSAPSAAPRAAATVLARATTRSPSR